MFPIEKPSLLSLFLAGALAGCVAQEVKEPDLAPDYGAENDAKFDSARYPAQIEPIAFGQIATARFTGRVHYVAYTFDGQAGQQVDLYVDGLDWIDTVLYLYRVSATTGRPYGYPVAANDDTENPGWVVSSNPEPNDLSSNVLAFALPETRRYALVATTYRQWYTGMAEVVVKTPEVARTCGGFVGARCPEGQVCMYEPGMCQVPDMIGTCMVPPGETGFTCAPPNPAVDNRVCGCDDQTYVDACHARMLGVSILHEGPCKPPVCQPFCGAIGSRSEGWYDGCTSELISYAFCSDCTAECGAIGTRSEGWYSSCGGGLIKWDDCAP